MQELSQLSNNFIKRSRAIDARFISFNWDLTTYVQVEMTTYCAISLYSEWEKFIERLIFCSAARRPSTRSGIKLPFGLLVEKHGDYQTALTWACSPIKRKKPATIYWGNANKSIMIAKNLGVANLAEITSSLGSVDSKAEEVRLVRNFVSHQNRDTFSKCSSVAAISGLADLPGWCGQIVSGGHTRFSSWCRNLETMSVAATR